MDPQAQFCHNPDCTERGKAGHNNNNIEIHSRKERRYRCKHCGRTFVESRGTPFYRLHKPVELFTVVLTLLCHGCPIQALVAAFGLDERTVAAWQTKAGQHCQKLHEHLVGQGKVELEHVQEADELWVKLVGKKVWMAMAMAAPSRLWLGGVVSVHRDHQLITTLAQLLRACAASPAVLVCVDGLASYDVKAFGKVWRKPLRTGLRGRPKLVPEEGLLLGQVIKSYYAKRRVRGVSQRVVQGTIEAIEAVLSASATGTQINTAYIERLNATFRASLAPLLRRTRAIARKEAMLTAGMWVVGCAYNFCWPHHSLRLGEEVGARYKWKERTPAMAAGLTEHIWTIEELLRYRIPLPEWVAPKKKRRRRRPSKHAPPPQPAVELAA